MIGMPAGRASRGASRRARLPRRQPPGASTYGQFVPLAPGGLELAECPRLGPRGRPYRVAGRPLRAGAPNPDVRETSRPRMWGSSTHQLLFWSGDQLVSA